MSGTKNRKIGSRLLSLGTNSGHFGDELTFQPYFYDLILFQHVPTKFLRPQRVGPAVLDKQNFWHYLKSHFNQIRMSECKKALYETFPQTFMGDSIASPNASTRSCISFQCQMKICISWNVETHYCHQIRRFEL